MATLEDRLDELLLELGTDYKTLWAEIQAAKSQAATGAPAATEAVAGIVTLASLLDMASGQGNKVATVAGVRQERLALRDEILGGAGPMADTLAELHAIAQAAEESGEIANLLTLVEQKANSDDVYTKTELGNVDRDLRAAYLAAKA